MVEGNEEVEIERILKERKTRDGVAEFLVRWKGFDESENEWIKEYDMQHAREAVEEFRRDEALRGRKRNDVDVEHKRARCERVGDKLGKPRVEGFFFSASVLLFPALIFGLEKAGQVSRYT
ncbi:hypothetical protein BJ912DRAFT_451946 [Pholiota molesta]|nr:hypothetical protein BJ912DRAFT_451946 [Pholiota molesta]